MKKSFFIPLVAAIVAAAGAHATAETGMRVDAFGRNASNQCTTGELLEPERCSNNETDDQCQVEIDGLPKPAYSDANCMNEIFRQPEN
ncbi:hypothetical protein [Parapedobacter lycopersici]|uniref:hypothetical protein n=1 Tax=Parapedobacter lycopersici TaxID=1864939 RepID=UPI00214D9CED|nr:hypothetical protein [Parapedobacter lycopersici]